MRQGWEIKKLGDIVDFQRGLTYSKKDEVDYSSNVVLRANNVNLDNNSLDFGELKYINENVIVPKDKKVLKGSLLICTASGSKNHWGKVALIDDEYDFAFGGFMGQITPRQNIDSKFLFYALTSNFYKEFIGNLSDGVNINNLKYDDLKQFSFSVPSIHEQQRIVAILNETFASISRVKANAEKNFINAKELFESYLQGLFENKGVDWEERKLIEITTKIGSGATPRGGKESYKTQGISLIRSMNVHDLEFRDKNLAFIDEQQAKELDNVELQENDVLLNITGASVARCCIIPKTYLPARVNQHVLIIRTKKKIVNPFFLVFLLNSKFYKDKLLFIGEQGSTRQAITKAQIEFFDIKFPKSLIEQQSIVQKLNTLSSEAKKLEAIYEKKIEDLEELKKSILQKAFSGELNTIEITTV